MNVTNGFLPIPDNITFPDIPGPPPDLAVGSVAYQLLRQREAIQDSRFALDEEIHNLITRNWQHYRQMLWSWLGKVDSTLAELRETGALEAATWLENYLVVSPIISDPNNFKSMVQTGFGTQAVMFLGQDNSRNRDEWFGNGPRNRSNGSQTSLHLPQPVQLATWNYENKFRKTISLRDAVSGRLWISYLPTGVAFCVRCPCEDLISPKPCLVQLSTDPYRGKSFEFIPRHFHSDPFEDNFALHHFSTCHGIEFTAGNAQMLETYGLRVKPTDGDELDPWFIAAHNMVATAWREEALSNWRAQIEARRQPRTSSLRSDPNRDSFLTSRRIDRGLLRDTMVFSWPLTNSANANLNTNQWAVFCTFPDCFDPGFSKHPFHERRAFKHFASHGVVLSKNHEILEKFGFRVYGDNALGDLAALQMTKPINTKRGKANDLKNKTIYDRIVKFQTPALVKKCLAHGIDPEGLSRSMLVQKLTLRLQADAKAGAASS